MRTLMILALLTTACGGKQTTTTRADLENFDCKERRAAYVATGTFAGREVGVVIDCAERGPRVKKWRLLGEGDDRKTIEHSLTPGEFDTLWEKLESTGWRQLEDCDNPDAVEGDPEYKIGIKDHALAVAVTCAGKELPFPYNRLVNELDLKVAEYGE